jgi:putative ABC transport system permease protein
MGIDTGDYVTVVVRTRTGSWNAYDFTVVGLLGTSDLFIDMNSVVMDLATADELLNMDGAVTEIAVRLGGMADAEPARERFEAAGFAGLEAWTWRELGELIFQITGTKRAGGFVLTFVVIVIAAVGIINTMLMAVMERTREIGSDGVRLPRGGLAFPLGGRADRGLRQPARCRVRRRRGDVPRFPRH